jgi:hypothetical protein
MVRSATSAAEAPRAASNAASDVSPAPPRRRRVMPVGAVLPDQPGRRGHGHGDLVVVRGAPPAQGQAHDREPGGETSRTHH